MRTAAAPLSGSGVTHENTRHTTRFTVVGNHLTQHRELSLLAIGLACHIQSLPAGAPTDIKTLAARFPEGATRIAAALRELEAHGYLRRERVRTPAGRIVTRTVSCNQPRNRQATHHHKPPHEPGPTVNSGPAPAPALSLQPAPAPGPALEPAPAPAPDQAPARSDQPCTRNDRPRAPRKKRPLPPVPRPGYPAPALLQQAAELLAGLHRRHPGLLLSACDTEHLAPGVAAWLEREVTPTAVRHALTAGLPPEGVHHPAAFLAHRLITQLPPPPPFRAPAAPPPPRSELRNCDGCDHAFRAFGTEDRCRRCREAASGDPTEVLSDRVPSHTH